MMKGGGVFEPHRPWSPERRAAASKAAKDRIARKRLEQAVTVQTKITLGLDDDGIRETHGVMARKLDDKGIRILLHEREKSVELATSYTDALMTPTQARYIADRLYALAGRIDARATPSQENSRDAPEPAP